MIATCPLPATRKHLVEEVCDAFDYELIIDGFAGGGGTSVGIEMGLGRSPDIAVNHDRYALGMHRVNHPRTRHLCEDVFRVDPRKVTHGRPVGFAWFSPDCKHFSKAKGGKPLSKKIRGLVLVILWWASAVRPRVIGMENVEEIQDWGPLLNGRPDPRYKGRTWKAFLAILGQGIDPNHPDLPYILRVLKGHLTKEQCVRGLGYEFEGREIRACVTGAPTIRNRFYLIARCDGRPIVWPAPTHVEPKEVRNGYRPWRTIAECIDWSIPCPSIFLTRRQAKKAKCKRPLAKSTRCRIAAGVDRYVMRAVEAFLVSLTHHGGNRIEPLSEPARTITGANGGEKALVNVLLAPFITEHANASNQRNMPASEPMRTLCAEVKGGHFALCAVGMVKLRGDAETHAPGHPANEPGHTISAGGTHLGMFSASLVAYFGSEADGQSINQSLRTVTTRDRFGLARVEVRPRPLTDKEIAGARRVARFLRRHGVQFEGEFAMVGDYVIIDIGMRMLTPRELFLAQGFPRSYIIDRALIPNGRGGLKEVELSKKRQIKMCGNSVCPTVAAALAAVNVPELAIWKGRERDAFEKYLETLRHAVN
jgi:DNA (cytosine-5)-methyltransferase 1